LLKVAGISHYGGELFEGVELVHGVIILWCGACLKQAGYQILSGLGSAGVIRSQGF
jgi:hypothetical protein